MKRFWWFCFRDDGEVEVQGASGPRTVAVAEVKPGDRVLTSAGYQPVVYVHHGGVSGAVVQVDFVAEDGRRGTIGLTPAHLIYTTGDQVKKAEELQVGDAIQAYGRPAEVVALRPETAAVRSLITANGELLVNGVRVSSYAFDERLHHLTQSVAWLSGVHPQLPDKLCQAASPAMMRWVMPLCFEDVHELKRAQKAAEKEAKAAAKDERRGHTWGTVRRLGGAAAC